MVEQPKAVAYKPVRDLIGKITLLAVWLILLTAIGAWLAGRFTRRQTEAARRIEREVIFNEKILANMPSGIALVDPSIAQLPPGERRLRANGEEIRRSAHGKGYPRCELR